MAKIDKLIERLKNKPKPKDFKWTEAVRVLRYCGYILLKSGATSHRTFYNEERNHMYHTYEPHPKKILRDYMVQDLLDIVNWHEKEHEGTDE